jgi:hypothetical protein
MIFHGKIRLHAHTAGAIRCGLEPLAGRRRRHPRGPDNGTAGDVFAGHAHAIGVDMIDAVAEPNLDTELLKPTHRRRGERLGKRPEHPLSRVDEDDPRRRRIDPSKLRSQRPPHELGHRPRHLDTRGAGPHEHERQQIVVTLRVFLRFRLLERLQDSVSDRDRIGEALEPGREWLEFVVSEVAVAGTRRENQIVVFDSDVGTVHGVDEHASPIGIHAGHFAEDHRRVGLLPQNSANRRCDLSRAQNGCRDLVQQRLKQMVILPVDEDDLGVGLAERFPSGQPAEATADDHDARYRLRHGCGARDGTLWPSRCPRMRVQ